MARGDPLPTVGQIERWAAMADAGDMSALKNLGDANARIGRLMNQRMRELEKAGETSDAYARLGELTGKERPRFSQAKTGTAEHLRRSALQSLRGYGYEKSTLTGIANVREENITSLLQNLGKLEEGETADRATVNRMSRFFKSDYWKQNRSRFVSGGLEEVADLAISGGPDYLDFMDAIENDDQGSEWYQVVDKWVDFSSPIK